jgi:hypothetical protein
VIGRTYRKWVVDPFPACRSPPLEIRVREKAVDRDRTEAFGGVKDEDRDVPREECGERRSHRLRRPTRNRNENASYELQLDDEPWDASHDDSKVQVVTFADPAGPPPAVER